MVAVKKSAKPIEAEDGEIFSASSFSSLGLHSNLCNQRQERLGFKAPTLVQAQAIPVILSGRHVLVNAATGTGKTVAYLAPVIHHLSLHQPRIQRSDGTFALVLVPTRELCLQVHQILQKLLHRFHWIVPGYVMGAENRAKEKARLRKGSFREPMASKLPQLQTKVIQASKILAKNGITYYKHLMEKNKGYIQEPPTIEKCLTLAKQLFFQFKPNSGPGSKLKQKFLRCKTFRLHGNMKQVDRRTTFETFKTEKSALLLSTVAAARGLDFRK